MLSYLYFDKNDESQYVFEMPNGVVHLLTNFLACASDVVDLKIISLNVDNFPILRKHAGPIEHDLSDVFYIFSCVNDVIYGLLYRYWTVNLGLDF